MIFETTGITYAKVLEVARKFRVDEALVEWLDGYQYHRDAKMEIPISEIRHFLATLQETNPKKARLFARWFVEQSYLGGSLDFSGLQLSRSDFSGLSLTLYNLRGVNLEESNLICAWLNGANLSGAHMYGADLEASWPMNANFQGADLRKVFPSITLNNEWRP